MSKTNSFVFTILHIIMWIIFVGLCIEAGGLLVNFIVSQINPGWVGNLYEKLDLSDMWAKSRFAFYSSYGLILCISILKAWIFYIVIRLMHKMNLTKPFSPFVSRQISLVSYFTLSVGLLSYIGMRFSDSLSDRGFATGGLNGFMADSQAFILTGAVIYMIAVIFQNGVELQHENDLTV